MKTASSKTRDWTLIILSCAVIFGCGFAASHTLSAKSERPLPANLTAWEANALLNLRDSLSIRPEQEQDVVNVLNETQGAINETRERALLEFHYHLLNSHEKLSPLLDAEQQQAMRKSREALEKTIRAKFPDLLEKHQSSPLTTQLH